MKDNKEILLDGVDEQIIRETQADMNISLLELKEIEELLENTREILENSLRDEIQCSVHCGLQEIEDRMRLQPTAFQRFVNSIDEAIHPSEWKVRCREIFDAKKRFIEAIVWSHFILKHNVVPSESVILWKFDIWNTYLILLHVLLHYFFVFDWLID